MSATVKYVPKLVLVCAASAALSLSACAGFDPNTKEIVVADSIDDDRFFTERTDGGGGGY